VGLAVSLVLFATFPMLLVYFGYRGQVTLALVLAMGLELLAAASVLAITLYWEHSPLTSVGIISITRKDILWGFIGFAVGILTFAVTSPMVAALGLSTTASGITVLGTVPIIERVAIVLTAGITEEIIFRGYFIERLSDFSNRLWVGAVISYFAFVIPHVSIWGIGGTIQIGAWALVVTALYVKRRRLSSCILMHILNDGFAFLALPLLLPH